MKNRLKDLREDHDLTQQMVADQIGITQRKYSCDIYFLTALYL